MHAIKQHLLEIKKERQRQQCSQKEEILVSEIGLDHITSATAFVDYVSDKYGFSRSGVWYTLKKLKQKGMVDFAEKGEQYRPLELTRSGIATVRSVVQARIGVSRGVYSVAARA
ncbi:MAG: hypothetical protein ACP5K9_03025 [Candidatus Micrarchaeia archaeon]